MNFITQLLPGLRDVRGPLIAGYLWLFAGWLLLAGHLPDRDAAGVYARSFEVGDVLGRAGLAAAVSIAAYLLGSLLQAAMSWIDSAHQWAEREIARRQGRLVTSSQTGGFVVQENAEALLFNPPVYALDDFRWVDGDERTKQALEDLVSNRLRGCRNELVVAIADATAKIRAGAGLPRPEDGDDPTTAMPEIEALGSAQTSWSAKGLVAAVAGNREDEALTGKPVALPSFSAAKHLFGERSTIKTRLMETAQHAGSEVERFYAESDFRFTIAFPLAVVAGLLTWRSHDYWWLFLVLVAGGLLMQSIVLRKHGGREMVEALRSRPDPKQLDQITPVFKRYEEDADNLIRVLGKGKWEALAAAIPRDGEGECPGS